jgi:hypothetical protein
MSAIRFCAKPGLTPSMRQWIVAGWVVTPGQFFLEVYHGRERTLEFVAEEVEPLQARLTKLSNKNEYNTPPPDFWRMVRRKEEAVFYQWADRIQKWTRISA